MPDIVHDFLIKARAEEVYRAVSTPSGLDAWWTLRSSVESAEPHAGSEYRLDFGPDDDWRAVVSRVEPGHAFELKLTEAQDDWLGTRVGVELEERDGTTQVRFYHRGWSEDSRHYRVSNYCWAMYLRLLKRFVEQGEVVPYGSRLDA